MFTTFFLQLTQDEDHVSCASGWSEAVLSLREDPFGDRFESVIHDPCKDLSCGCQHGNSTVVPAL